MKPVITTELMSKIQRATNEKDGTMLVYYSRVVDKAGHKEWARSLAQLGRRYEREEWAYDEAKDNELEDKLINQ